MTESNEGLPAQDEADLQAMLDEAPPRTLLETWDKLLESAATVREERIAPDVAVKIVQSWPELKYSDLPAYNELFFSHVEEAHRILKEEIAKNDNCLLNVDNDAEENGDIYRELIFLWQKHFLEVSHEWDPASVDAAVALAAMGRAQSFLFEPGRGLINHLDHLKGFEFGDADRDAMGDRLRAVQEEL